MNKGFINNKNEYIKHIKDSNGAILNKYGGELSIPPGDIEKIRKNDVKVLRFVFKDLKQLWTFNAKTILAAMILRRVGQEPQYYFDKRFAEITPLLNADQYTDPDTEIYIPLDSRLKLAQMWKQVLAAKKNNTPMPTFQQQEVKNYQPQLI